MKRSVYQPCIWLLFMLLFILQSCNSQKGSDLIPVKVDDGEFVYIDAKGKVVIDNRYEYASVFRDGVALVEVDGKMGYIDTKGKYILPPEYKSATIFNEGVAWVVPYGGHPMLINTKGKVILNATYEFISIFNDGIAVASTYDEDGIYINKKGEKLFSAREEMTAGSFFSNGLSAIESEKGWGYINKKNEIAIDYQFDTAGDFYPNGLAVVSVDGKYGVINKKGKYVVNPQYDHIILDQNGMMYRLKGECGHLDLKGKEMYKQTYASIAAFAYGDYAGACDDKQWGIINKSGKMVVSPQFNWVSCFSNGLAAVAVGGKYGFINTKGEMIINPIYRDVSEDYFYAALGCIDRDHEKFAVASDYFDMSFVDEKLMPLINKLGEKYVGKPLNSFIRDFSFPVSDIRTYGSTLFSKQKLTEGVQMTLYLSDAPTHRVSDGWWGTVTQINKNGIVKQMHIELECSGEAWGKEEQIIAKMASVGDYENIMNKERYAVSNYAFGNASECLVHKDSRKVLIHITAVNL